MKPLDRDSSRANGVALLLALTLHAVAFFATRTQRSTITDATEAREVRSSEQAVEIELREDPQNAEPKSDTSERSPVTAQNARPRAHAPSTRPPAASAAALAPDPASDARTANEALASTSDDAPANEHRPLSLDALGVGDRNPFVAPPGGPRTTPNPRAVGRSRFQRSLAEAVARSDQAAGVGPEGPVLAELEFATRHENPALNSNAVFDCITDASGRLLRVDLVSTSSNPEPWRRVARAVAGRLAALRLKVPHTGYGLTFRIRVTSHVELPSGADPGLEVNIAGIPVQHGAGPRSTRIAILDVRPSVTSDQETLPSGQALSIPRLSIGTILSVTGDLSDVGAVAQRMVRAHVERMSVNEETAR